MSANLREKQDKIDEDKGKTQRVVLKIVMLGIASRHGH
jgi:hypothetical protein